MAAIVRELHDAAHRRRRGAIFPGGCRIGTGPDVVQMKPRLERRL